MPGLVRLLIGLLVVTALSTAGAEVLNWWFNPDADYALFVRTAWALVRSLAFLLVIWQVRRGRASAAPFALVLAITTLFALGRLLVPKHGAPTALSIAAFAWVALLCLTVSLLLYKSSVVRGYLSRRARASRRAPMPARLITARVAALTYSPLVVVAAVIALGRVFAGQVELVTIVLPWLAGGLALSFPVSFLTLLLMRGTRWPAVALVWLTGLVVAIDLPLCWLVLGPDGLVRDGSPLVAAAVLVIVSLMRPRRMA